MKDPLNMCTRFYIEKDAFEMPEVLHKATSSSLASGFIRSGSAVLTSGEIRPTNVVPVIASDRHGNPSVFPMRWGYNVRGVNLVINARSEGASKTSIFAKSWSGMRCIVPASWYYEWKHQTDASGKKKPGEKYMIQPVGQHMTFLAGLYRIENGFPEFVVLTKEPVEDLKTIHDRMPLIFPRELIADWIKPDTQADDLLPYTVGNYTLKKIG